jgi:cell wall-associated NlpC family hydrolase
VAPVVKILVLGAVAGVVVAVLSFPILVIMMFSPDPTSASAACATTVATADGSPTILGGSALSATQITAWWVGAHGRTTPIGVDPATFIGWWIDHGNAEGVRGDLAFAQAIFETGYFSNSDSQPPYNNYAGIGHPDGAAHGIPFSSPETGVVADLQTLKEVATGSNNGPFSEPKVAPNWQGRPSATWYQLGNQGNGDRGFWASAPAAQYWAGISGVYKAMGGFGGTAGGGGAPPSSSPQATLVGATNPIGCGGSGSAAPGCATSGTLTATTAASPATTAVNATADPLGPMWAFACAQLGKPYLWGGAGPNSWDCSGLTQAAYGQIGVRLSHNAQIQFNETHGVVGFAKSQLQPGDLVFFGTADNIHHVGIAVDTGRMLDAPSTGSLVRIDPLFPDYYGASRPVTMAPAHV